MCAVLCNVQNSVSWLKISKNEEKYGIELLKFSIEKVLKKYGKQFFLMCGNPLYCVHFVFIYHAANSLLFKDLPTHRYEILF